MCVSICCVYTYGTQVYCFCTFLFTFSMRYIHVCIQVYVVVDYIYLYTCIAPRQNITPLLTCACTCMYTTFFIHVYVHVRACILYIQVRMYCETQPRFAAKTWLELFPDDSFPNDTPEDRARSKNMYIYM